MSTSAVKPSPALPDYLTDPNAVLEDAADWRYGKPPDYSNTRAVWERSSCSLYLANSPFLSQYSDSLFFPPQPRK